ncbi:unnamed protein product [Trichobilharzia regenti]|nr:unnamed protein product [Trichobilharzia regenti]
MMSYHHLRINLMNQIRRLLQLVIHRSTFYLLRLNECAIFKQQKNQTTNK